MKTLVAVVLIFCLVSASFAQDLGWPREKSNAGGTIIYYQPQLDEWKDYRQIDARMAVSIKTKTGRPAVGVVHLRARTDANLDTRNVVLSHLEITSTNFPSLHQARRAALDQVVMTFLAPPATLNIPLLRFLVG